MSSQAWPILLLSILLALAIFLSLGIGAVNIPPARVWAVLNPQASIDAVSPATRTIVWDLRLARVLLAALVGGSGFPGFVS